jgi:hypothetical protein
VETAGKPTLEEVLRLIDALGRTGRAMLRPWILAHYDDDGMPQARIPAYLAR